MASALQSLKDALVRDTAAEERVEVNQRHLIDKILARYSADNDAGAESAEIHFITDKDSAPKATSFFSFPWSKTAVVTQVVYKNNGRPFSEEDFGRLRKIAEGNPDEQKIGFFGVGFYSLFSLCEEPFVTSGKQSMAFLWKNDMLFTKRGALPNDAVSEWTTFFLAMRDPIDIPKTSDFGRFLATSLAFTTSMRDVKVFVDADCVLHFNKKGAPPRPVEVPNLRSFNLTSPNSTFKLISLSMAKVQLDVKTKGWRDLETFTIFMRIATAPLAVTLPRKLAEEMKRTTKKNPPSETTLRIMFSNFDEYESSATARSSISIFTDLIPGPTEQGKIFIGFPTHQTTGCAIQLAGHLIPTVERESIDFVDRSLAYWNMELLAMGGLLARLVYELDLDSVQELYDQMTLDSQSRLYLEKKAVHTMNSFTFKQTTPSPVVGRVITQHFFDASKTPLRIVSDKGIRLATEVRLPVPAMMGFIRTTPLLPDVAAQNSKELVARLQENGMLRTLGLLDMFKEISERTLTVEEAVSLTRWWNVQIRRGDGTVTPNDFAKLQSLLVLQVTGSSENDKEPVPFSRLTHHINKAMVPPDLPLPNTVMPLSFSKHFVKDDLDLAFPWTKEMTLLEWAAFVTKHPDFATNASFVERVMATLSRNFGSIPDAVRTKLVALMSPTKCIVTQLGLVRPSEAYFPSVTLFKDLPKLEFTSPRSISDVMLRAMGVREHVDLQMVFDRINDLNWDQGQLVKYLASVQDKLSASEINKLKVTPIFLKEEPEASGSDAASKSSETGRRFCATSLYAPGDVLREFGLPLLMWTGKWRANSDEAKLMATLGLRSEIPLEDLIRQTAAASTHDLRIKWIKYLIDHFDTIYRRSYNPTHLATAFLPTQNPSILSTPRNCYLDSRAAIMGFQILHPDLKLYGDKLGIKEVPSSKVLLERLKSNPPTFENAPETFIFLSTQQAMFSASDYAAMKGLTFVPVKRQDQSIVYRSPGSVYFEGSDASSAYQAHFSYIDFGPAANSFLRSCGVKDQPSPLELATSVVKTPKDFLESLGVEGYLSLLRLIASTYETLRNNTSLVQQMKNSAFLLGVRSRAQEEQQQQQKYDGDDGGAALTSQSTLEAVDDNTAEQYCLAKASEIYLADDTMLSQIFQPLCLMQVVVCASVADYMWLPSAPIENILEFMYQDLGSQWLSHHVHRVNSPKGTPFTSAASAKLQGIINDRAALLMNDGQQMRKQKDLADPNVAKVLETLKVLEISSIDIVQTFDGVSKTRRTTACSAVSSRTREMLLLITSDFDYYDVASALGSIILKQPRLNDKLLLSMLLSSSLENLKRKGFPVDRIMNLIAKRNKPAIKTVVEKTTTPPTPASVSAQAPTAQQIDTFGASRLQEIINRMVDQGFPKAPDARSDSPPSDPTTLYANSNSSSTVKPDTKSPSKPTAAPPPPPPPSNDLFGMINKYAGIDLGKDVSSLTTLLTQSLTGATASSSTTTASPPPRPLSSDDSVPPPPKSITPSQTLELKSRLKQAIAKSSRVTSDTLRAQIPADAPAPPAPVQPVRNQCSVLSDNDLVLIYRHPSTRVPVYADRSVLEQGQQVVKTQANAVERFIQLLSFLARVFQLNSQNVHVYWDSNGSTIAFNRANALFFNLRFFIGLHAQGRNGSATASESQTSLPGAFSPSIAPQPGLCDELPDAFFYWFMTFCHELAHNYVG
eukprot:jgi/Hompol1/3316/HPOL_003212-RA